MKKWSQIIPKEVEIAFGDCSNEFELALVIAEHKDRYKIQFKNGKLDAQITGGLRYQAEASTEFPAVGDWVLIQRFEEQAIIHRLLPRKNVLSRKAVSYETQSQIISANIDVAFIVQSVKEGFSLNRIDRYLSICYDSNITPKLILTKIDLISNKEKNKIISQVTGRNGALDYFVVDNTNDVGLIEIKKELRVGASYCFVGSSGVGKSTIINKLVGEKIMKTAEISKSTSKGSHTTSHRQLIILPSGAILIDVPGMRELGLNLSDNGLDRTFNEISKLSKDCKFKDCQHLNEPGCMVLEALKAGDLFQSSYDNYIKMKKEQEYYEATIKEKRDKYRTLGKIYKEAQSKRKRDKF